MDRLLSSWWAEIKIPKCSARCHAMTFAVDIRFAGK